MKKLMQPEQKMRGRPATGVTPMMGLRVSGELRAAIVKWAECQPDAPKLSEAIRRLVEIGLSKSPGSPKTPRVLSTARQGAARAAELAGHTIDRRMDREASPEERASRKRKLIEGPGPFRGTRKDR